MAIVYNLAIFLYGIIVRIATLFNPKAKLFVYGRKNIWRQLKSVPRQNVVWFHAASLGEFEQGKPVMEALKLARPEINLVVTFFSPSGYEQRKNYEGASVFYLPLDTPKNAKRFVKTLNPKLVVFIRYEFWANYLDALYKANVPTAVMSAQFRADQFAFGTFGGYIRKRILRLRAILVQYQSAKPVSGGPQLTGIGCSSRMAQMLKKLAFVEIAVSTARCKRCMPSKALKKLNDSRETRP